MTFEKIMNQWSLTLGPQEDTETPSYTQKNASNKVMRNINKKKK